MPLSLGVVRTLNCLDERMQNNQMHKILIEVVQRTAPNKNRQRHSKRKTNGLSISDPPNSTWKKNPNQKNQVNIPQKSTPNHHWHYHQIKSINLPIVASGYPPWTLSLYPHVFRCSVATGSGAIALQLPVRRPNWRAGNGPLIPTAGTKSVDGLPCTWGLYIDIYIWNMIYVKHWCKLIFYKYARCICWFIFFWTVRRNKV